MTSNPVVWFEIYVSDMERAKRFYEAVLDLKLARLPTPESDAPTAGLEMWSFPMAIGQEGAAGALCKMEGMTPSGAGTVIYFRCDDCAVEAGRVQAAGGTLDRPKFSIGQYGAIALARDPDGNMFGLHSMA